MSARIYPTAVRVHGPKDMPRIHLMRSERFRESLCGRHCEWEPAPYDAAPICRQCDQVRRLREKRANR